MLRWAAVIVISAATAAAGLFVIAGRAVPPAISIDQPSNLVGQRGTLEVSAVAPDARFIALTIALEQNGRTIPLFSLETPGDATITQPSADQVRISRPLGKESVPDLQAGPARIVVAASRTSFLNLRTLSSTAAKDVQIRLEPPRLAVVSTHHYINHGGSEMVVYRATPADVASGVRVGGVDYPGYAATGAGVPGLDPSLKVAFFALLHDQDLTAPIALFARDDAGNESTAPFIDEVFEKPFRRSRIELDDAFLQRVVPEILQRSPELNLALPAAGELLPAFQAINGELRGRNAEAIARTTAATAAARLWNGPFVQLGNSQVEASFADHRTYFYKGEEVDQQVHLGFDLAVTSAVPLISANTGSVLHAGWLGIYGNCVIVDHGMGVASLYGHLSSIDVKVGDKITKSQMLGRSGMTGLAGGDHLHFTMLVQGRAVNPVEWWDPHWVQDRVDRKLREAATRSSTAAP